MSVLFAPVICMSGVFGLALIPFVLVSYWYMGRLFFYSGDLSPTAMRKFYLALSRESDFPWVRGISRIATVILAA